VSELARVDAEVESSAIQKREGSISALGSAPTEIIENGVAIANQLKRIVESASLVKNISGKKYVMAEGWTTLGAMLSVFPQVEWTRRMELGAGYAWECRVLLVKDGKTLSSAEAMAASSEGAPWARNEYSVRSMAQTRATGKAFRLAFSWVMTLAGFEPTPAEEMPATETKKPRRASAATAAAKDGTDTPPAVAKELSLARYQLMEAMSLLHYQHPDVMPFTTSDNSPEALKARIGIMSQVLGFDVTDPKTLTVEQLKAAREAILTTWSVEAK